MQITLIIILAVLSVFLAAWTFLLKKEADTKNKNILEISSKSAALENENKNLAALNAQTEAELKACREANDGLKEEISALKAKERREIVSKADSQRTQNLTLSSKTIRRKKRTT